MRTPRRRDRALSLSCLPGVVLLVACSSPQAPVPPEPAPKGVVVCDGFEDASLAAFWLPGDHGSGRYASGAVVLTEEHARSGRRSARITVRQGDVAQRGDSGQANERAELDSGKRHVLGQDSWCGFSFLVPPDFPIADVRLVLSQWKQSALDGSPIVAQRYRAGRHWLTVRDLQTSGEWRDEFELPAIVPGTWHDMHDTPASTARSGRRGSLTTFCGPLFTRTLIALTRTYPCSPLGSSKMASPPACWNCVSRLPGPSG